VIDSSVAFKCNETFSVISTALDPNIIFSPVNEVVINDDDITVIIKCLVGFHLQLFNGILLGSSSAADKVWQQKQKRVSVSTANFDCYSSANIKIGIRCDNYCIE
jgi:hypothetical protein